MKTEFSPAQLADPAVATSESQIRKCVRCGFCNATCPTYVLLGDERDSPRGRIYAIKDMLENGRAPTAETVTHIDRCLSCLACVTTCPSGVNYMRLIDHARAYINERYRRPLIDRTYRRLLGAILPHPARMRLAMALSRLVRPLAPSLARVAPLKSAAAMIVLTPPRAAPLPPAKTVYPPTAPERGRVALLQGCAEPVLKPEIRAATIRLLNRMGLEVVLTPGEVCCGSLVHHMGDENAARAAARTNVSAWIREREHNGLDAILVTVSGCGTALKNYGFLLREDAAFADPAATVSALACDVSEVIAQFGLPPATLGPGLTVAYQSACSLQHGQQINDLPADLLTAAGFVVKRPAEAHLCCGSAGTYNILQPDIAAQLRDRKLANLSRLAPDVIASGNIGCITQLSLAAGVSVVHTVQLLDWATGGPNPLSSTSDLLKDFSA